MKRARYRFSLLFVVGIVGPLTAAFAADLGGNSSPADTTPRSRAAGETVVWMAFPPQKQLTNPSWGRFLTDIENHLPADYGSTYRDADKVTWCHETTHGINSHLRNRYGGAGRNAFYVGFDRAALVDEPRLTLGQIAQAIPPGLRGSHYQTYLVEQRGEWDRRPLYLWDEWIAYTNGARTALELAAIARGGKDDCMLGMLQFNVYALYVVKLAQENHTDSKQLLEFFAWNWHRSLRIWEAGKVQPQLNWDNGAYWSKVLRHPDVRAFLVRNQIQ
jgi:hypothetical protein